MALYSMGSVGTWAKMPQPPSNLKELNYELPSLSTSLPSSFKTSLPSLPSSLPRSKVLEEAMADAVAMKRSATKAASAATAFASKLRTNASTGQMRYHAVAEDDGDGGVVYGQVVGHVVGGLHGDYLDDLDDPSRDDVSYSHSASAPSNPPTRKGLFSDLSPRGSDSSEKNRSAASSGSGEHAATGGNADESPRQPAPRSWAPAEKHGWDASRYAGVRPLQCSSIWDIPTSRFPEPERLSPSASRTAPSSSKAMPSSAEGRLPMPMVDGHVVRAISGGTPAWRTDDDAGFLRGKRHRLALLVVLIFLVAFAWR